MQDVPRYASHSDGFPCRERVRLPREAQPPVLHGIYSRIPTNIDPFLMKGHRLCCGPSNHESLPSTCWISLRENGVAFLPYLYADRTAKYPASSGSPSSASRLSKSSGCRLNVTAPSLRGHWLGCRSQANSIPLKSGSCR